MKLIVAVITLSIISYASMVYCEVKFGVWFSTHRRSQGMPMTTDLIVADFLATPAFWIRNQLEVICKN